MTSQAAWLALLGLQLPAAAAQQDALSQTRLAQGGDELSQEQLAQAVQRAEAVQEGSGGPVLSAFVDERCAACRLLMQRLRPLIDSGRLTVRWIAVQVLAPDAPASAAVRANTALLELLTGAAATPTLVYRAADGSLRIRAGSAGDLPLLP